ncbi:secretory phospholipase A2 receptor-like [Palaemon carinicauda]|uniref:secretory phospholipase A2 receptor-like n=1 Tax=Palaemon carinicauda TaxID=392227 RepID=UPI0035B5FE1B
MRSKDTTNLHSLTCALRNLLATALLFPIVPTCAKPGNYITTQSLENKWLPNPMKTISIVYPEECLKRCIKHPTCDGYAVSTFERKCRLYEIQSGVPPVKNNGYRIYIRMKTEEEGYYVYNTQYIKLYFERKNAIDAAKTCAQERGMLVAIRNVELDMLVWRLLVRHNVWSALIGLSRPSHDKPWEYSDGGPAIYTHWDWNGEWPRKNFNCALTQYIIDAPVWKHTDCWELNYFICQIPMF